MYVYERIHLHIICLIERCVAIFDKKGRFIDRIMIIGATKQFR